MLRHLLPMLRHLLLLLCHFLQLLLLLLTLKLLALTFLLSFFFFFALLGVPSSKLQLLHLLQLLKGRSLIQGLTVIETDLLVSLT